MDNVSAANASMSSRINAAAVKGAHCKKCDSTLVAWAQSKKSGKWYLCDATIGPAGKVLPSPHLPHFKTCGTRTTKRFWE